MDKITFEVAAESINSVKMIQDNRVADRIELCDNLLVGGTTPSAGFIEQSRSLSDLPIMILIRPRPGDFHYSDSEFEVMLSDIMFAKIAGANGIVTGILKPDGKVDRDRMAKIVDSASPMEITFHRAIDMTPDPIRTMDVLVELGINRVLTSGQKASAWDGRGNIRKLVDHAKGRGISVMAGGGVNERNVQNLLVETGVKEVHASARDRVESKMTFRRYEMSMASPISLNEYQWMETNQDTAYRIRKQIDNIL